MADAGLAFRATKDLDIVLHIEALTSDFRRTPGQARQGLDPEGLQVCLAETTPLRHPELYQYDIDTTEVAEVWRRGSVIASWLLDLTALALKRDPELSNFTGRVSDSGEGRWTAIAAIDEGVPAYVLTNSLFERFESRGEGDYAGKIMSAMRMEFGGHHEKPGS